MMNTELTDSEKSFLDFLDDKKTKKKEKKKVKENKKISDSVLMDMKVKNLHKQLLKKKNSLRKIQMAYKRRGPKQSNNFPNMFI